MRLADLDDLLEDVVVGLAAEQPAEGQALDQRGQRHAADIGAVAVPDLDDVEGAQGLDRLPDAAAAGADGLAQLGLGGQQVARLELVAQDVLLDPGDHLLAARTGPQRQ